MVMNIMLLLGACIAALLTATVLATFGIMGARRANRTAHEAQARLTAAETRIAALETAMNAATARAQALSDRLQQLAILQQRVDGPASRQALREAIALTRNGARPEQLVRNCGIGEGEARLIQALHGRETLYADTH